MVFLCGICYDILYCIASNLVFFLCCNCRYHAEKIFSPEIHCYWIILAGGSYYFNHCGYHTEFIFHQEL